MTKFAVPDDQMIISVNELKKQGLSMYKINQLVKQGNIVKLNKKYYENTNFQGEISDFYYAYAYVPFGVVCLMSAAVYHNLSRYRPDAVDVAVPRKKRVSCLPDWPVINLYYYTDERYRLGINTVLNGKNLFSVYDIEKTVTDIVYYREKIGIEETKEVLVNYLKREDRNLNRLVRYAEQMKCGEIMKKYLEVLV